MIITGLTLDEKIILRGCFLADISRYENKLEEQTDEVVRRAMEKRIRILKEALNSIC